MIFRASPVVPLGGTGRIRRLQTDSVLGLRPLVAFLVRALSVLATSPAVGLSGAELKPLLGLQSVVAEPALGFCEAALDSVARVSVVASQWTEVALPLGLCDVTMNSGVGLSAEVSSVAEFPVVAKSPVVGLQSVAGGFSVVARDSVLGFSWPVTDSVVGFSATAVNRRFRLVS